MDEIKDAVTDREQADPAPAPFDAMGNGCKIDLSALFDALDGQGLIPDMPQGNPADVSIPLDVMAGLPPYDLIADFQQTHAILSPGAAMDESGSAGLTRGDLIDISVLLGALGDTLAMGGPASAAVSSDSFVLASDMPFGPADGQDELLNIIVL